MATLDDRATEPEGVSVYSAARANADGAARGLGGGGSNRWDSAAGECGAPRAREQKELFLLGQVLYSLIVQAQKGPVEVVNLTKFFNAVENAVGSFEKMLVS